MMVRGSHLGASFHVNSAVTTLGLRSTCYRPLNQAALYLLDYGRVFKHF